MVSDDYLAGLFDGEGFFSIGQTWQLQARIVIRDESVVLLCQQRFGGSLQPQAPKSDKHALCYRWSVCDTEAGAFAEALKDKLVIKRNHAILAAEFQKFKSSGDNKPNSLERQLIFERFRLRLEALNKKGPRE